MLVGTRGPFSVDMHLVLLISLALCVTALAQREEPTSMKLTDAMLLNKILAMQAASVAKALEMDRAPVTKASPTPTQLSARWHQAFDEQNSVVNEPKGEDSSPGHHASPQKIYFSDGPFSDIPSDAFHLEQKEFRERRHVAKKDLSSQSLDSVPKELVDTCLDYFRGGHHSPSATELILNICTELLDEEGLDEFSVDDDKRQDVYELRASEPRHSHSSGECECCPLGHHIESRADNAVARTEHLLSDLLKMFKPVGHRREWTVLNSKNPDQRLRTYIDLKK